METLYENETKVTKEVLTEFNNKAFKVYGRIFRIVDLVLFILSTFFAIFILMYDGLSWYPILLLVCSAYFIFIYFKGNIFSFKQIYKNILHLYGENPQITTKFYDDKIELITNRSNEIFEYNKITKILETKNLYLIMIARIGIILEKEGFKNGSFNEFKEFINKKYKNI